MTVRSPRVRFRQNAVRLLVVTALTFMGFVYPGTTAPQEVRADTWSGCEYWSGECRFPEWVPPGEPGEIEQLWRSNVREGAVGESSDLSDIAGIIFFDNGTGQYPTSSPYSSDAVGEVQIIAGDGTICQINAETGSLEYLAAGACRIRASHPAVGDASAPTDLEKTIQVKPRLNVEMQVLDPDGTPREQEPNQIEDLAQIGDEVVVHIYTDDPNGANSCGRVVLFFGYTYFKGSFISGEPWSSGNYVISSIDDDQTVLAQPNDGCELRYIIPEPAVRYQDNTETTFGIIGLNRHGFLQVDVTLPGYALGNASSRSSTRWQFNAAGVPRPFEGTLCSEEGLEECLVIQSPNPGDYTEDYVPFEYNEEWTIAPPTTDDCELRQFGGYAGLLFSPYYSLSFAREANGCAPLEARIPAPAPSFMDQCSSYQCSAAFNFEMSTDTVDSFILAGGDNYSGALLVESASADNFEVGSGWAGVYPNQFEDATTTYPGTWTPTFTVSGAMPTRCTLEIDGRAEPIAGTVSGAECMFSVDGFEPSPEARIHTEYPYVLTVDVDGWDQPEIRFSTSVFVIGEPGAPEVYAANLSDEGATSVVAEGDGSVALLTLEPTDRVASSVEHSDDGDRVGASTSSDCRSSDAELYQSSERAAAIVTAKCVLADGTYAFTARQVDARGTVTEKDAIVTLRKVPPLQIGTSSVALDITGNLAVGKEATIRSAPWRGRPLPKVAFQWYRCRTAGSATSTSPASCKAIPGANQISYVVSRLDSDMFLRRAEVARSSSGTRVSYSSTSNRIPRLRNSRAVELRSGPNLLGSAKVGSVVSASIGRWTRSPIQSTIYWYRCESMARSAPIGTPDGCIPLGFGKTHVVTAQDRGFYLIARVWINTAQGASIAYTPTSGEVR